MKVLKIKLKQHTPLIHFQHHEEGATLRATEVKPKLDKFILQKLGNNNLENGRQYANEKKWLIGKDEHTALNYKMEIRPIGNIQIWDINKPVKKNNQFVENKKGLIKLSAYPAFFANMDTDYTDPYSYKRFSFAEKGLELIILTDSVEFYELLTSKPLISEFFFAHNFGTRSSKGFGSFYPDESDPLYQNLYSKYCFSFTTHEQNYEKRFQKLFKQIDLFYKTLRGGINEFNKDKECIFYFKSLIRTYCQEKWNADWGKKKIQNTLLNIPTEEPENSYIDVKNLFGFSTNEEWRGEIYHNTSITYNIAVQENNRQWRNPTEAEKKDLPTRMQSPILFKPVYDEKQKKFHIYLRLFPKRVNLSEFLGYRKIAANPKRNPPILIDLPESFKFSDFFNTIIPGLNLNNYIDEQYHEHEYFRTLTDIYSELKENLTNE